MVDPFVTPIDPGAPQDIESAAEGAERIRQLKRGLIERLSTAFGGFPEEFPARAGEAKLFPITSVLVGTEAERPGSPYRDGTVFIAQDSGRMYYGDREENWREFGGTGGGPLTSVGHGYWYLTASPEDSVNRGIIRRNMFLRVIGEVDTFGNLTIDLRDLDGDWLVEHVKPDLAVVTVEHSDQTDFDSTGDLPLFANLLSASVGGSGEQLLVFQVWSLVLTGVVLSPTDVVSVGSRIFQTSAGTMAVLRAVIPFERGEATPDEYAY